MFNISHRTAVLVTATSFRVQRATNSHRQRDIKAVTQREPNRRRQTDGHRHETDRADGVIRQTEQNGRADRAEKS